MNTYGSLDSGVVGIVLPCRPKQATRERHTYSMSSRIDFITSGVFATCLIGRLTDLLSKRLSLSLTRQRVLDAKADVITIAPSFFRLSTVAANAPQGHVPSASAQLKAAICAIYWNFLEYVLGYWNLLFDRTHSVARSLRGFPLGGRSHLNHSFPLIAIVCLSLAGCCQDNYKPLPETDYSKEKYASDLKECKHDAFYATRNPNEGSGALVGGAMGGIVGGIIGGAIGAGSTAGGAMGGSEQKSPDLYYEFIQKCMEGRGYEGKSTCAIK